MIVIGVAGGIASGKSLISEHFAQLGATVLDADRAGHAVLLLESVKTQVRNTFGEHVFGADGQIDRKALGRIVFDSPDAEVQLKKLERITHPRIRQVLDDQIAKLQLNDGEQQAVVLDAPVMFKSGWNDFCDVIVFVEAPTELRRQRAEQRGWTEGELDRREALQTPLANKRERSDWTIDNGGSIEETRRQVQNIWQQLFKNEKLPRSS